MKNKTAGYLAAQTAYSAYKQAAAQTPPRGPVAEQRPAHAHEQQSSFRKLAATELYCPKCGRAMPVRSKLLLHLPGGDLTDYVCQRCGTSLGTHQGK